VLFSRFVHEDKISVLERNQVPSKVAKKEVIPTNAFLGGEELLMGFREHFWGLLECSGSRSSLIETALSH
jgi:hypothetical protein